MFAYAAAEAVLDMQPTRGRVYRLIANMEPLASLSYVDDLAEQLLLERMLEQVKPPLPEAAEPLHPVLRAAFRYPGLPQGNRLSRAHEPGVYYGGSTGELALADAAYARLLFMHSIAANTLPDMPIRSEHRLVLASYRAERGVRLSAADIAGWYPPMGEVAAAEAQPLMTRLRRQGVEVVEYQTRTPLGSSAVGAAGVGWAGAGSVGVSCSVGVSSASASSGPVRQCKAVALLSPAALVNTVPQVSDHWLCEARPGEVVFSQVGHANLQVFRQGDFF